MTFSDHPSPARLAAANRLQKLLMLAVVVHRHNFEEVRGDQPHGLPEEPEELPGTGCPIDDPVELPVGVNHVLSGVRRTEQHGESFEFHNLVIRDAFGCPLCRLAAQCRQDREVIERLFGRHAYYCHATSWCNLDHSLEGQLEECLPDRRAADPELAGDPVEV